MRNLLTLLDSNKKVIPFHNIPKHDTLHTAALSFVLCLLVGCAEWLDWMLDLCLTPTVYFLLLLTSYNW